MDEDTSLSFLDSLTTRNETLDTEDSDVKIIGSSENIPNVSQTKHVPLEGSEKIHILIEKDFLNFKIVFPEFLRIKVKEMKNTKFLYFFEEKHDIEIYQNDVLVCSVPVIYYDELECSTDSILEMVSRYRNVVSGDMNKRRIRSAGIIVVLDRVQIEGQLKIQDRKRYLESVKGGTKYNESETNHVEKIKKNIRTTEIRNRINYIFINIGDELYEFLKSIIMKIEENDISFPKMRNCKNGTELCRVLLSKIPGIGEDVAVALSQKYGSIEKLYRCIENTRDAVANMELRPGIILGEARLKKICMALFRS